MTGVGAMDYSYNSKLRKASICLFYWVYYPGKVLIELCVGLEANFGQHPVKKKRSHKILFIFFGKRKCLWKLSKGKFISKVPGLRKFKSKFNGSNLLKSYPTIILLPWISIWWTITAIQICRLWLWFRNILL